MTCKRFAVIAALSLLPLLGQASEPDVGRKIYESVCSACHAPENVMVSAPKFGDAAEWRQRLERARGLDALTDHAVNGFAAMPPKGGHSELSREQIRQAIEFMMNQ